MMGELQIHPRIFERHPQLTERNIRAAWSNVFYEALRIESDNFPEYLWVGLDELGREIEMVGVPMERGWLVYHANTPLSKRTMSEMNRNGRMG